MKFRISNFEFRICRNAAGFTLMEVIIIIVIVAVFMATIGIPLLNSLQETGVPEIATIAYFLALERMEELEAQTAGSINPEGWTAVTVGEVTGLERKVAVCDVDCDTLTTSICDPPSSNPNLGSGCREVTVTVKHTPKLPNGVSLVSLRTAY